MHTTVVIGASRGLGYQFIKTLSSRGDTVIATARNVSSLSARLHTDAIPNTHIVHADLTSPSSLTAAAATTSTLTAGKIDHLIINGAYLSPTGGANPTHFTSKPDLFLSELNKSILANTAGPLFAINAFLPLLRAGTGKRITYISTGIADVPETLDVVIPNSVPYAASKAAGNLVIAKFAAELKGEGMVLLSVAPGGVATEGMTDLSALTDDEMQSMQAMMGRMMVKYPEWKGLISPEEAVGRILDVVAKTGVEDSGRFLSYWGNDKVWL